MCGFGCILLSLNILSISICGSLFYLLMFSGLITLSIDPSLLDYFAIPFVIFSIIFKVLVSSGLDEQITAKELGSYFDI